MKMKTVAFLDLLGFGQVALKDTVGAIELISDYQVIINNKVTDATIHPDLLTTAEEICADSFETLLPFSDSIFITSTDPNKFVKQVAHLLSHSFLINANQYSHPDNPSNPLETEITEIGITTRKIKTNRYPVLFRGGVSFGEVANLTINSIVSNNIAPLTNLTGEALVEAVYLEKAGKGPRIFCNKKFVDQLDQNTKDKFIGVVKADELYEIYWTTSIFFDQNDCRIDINEFDKHFIPAVNLWKAFNHLNYGIQYYEFIKLTVKGTLHNTGFASGGVTCKLGALCFYSSSVLVDSFVLRNPPERKARNR
jgi:hypothetical protein